MVNRRRRNVAQKRNNPRNNGKIRRMINRNATGFRISPPTDPPEYAPGPWWPLTVVMKCSADTSATPKDIYTSIIAQLDWTKYVSNTTVPLEMRVLTIRAWGTGKLPFQLTIFDHLGTKNRIAELSDYGSAINYSRIGWKFGNIGTSDALTSSDTDMIFEITGASTTNVVLCYVQVLIRAANTPKPVLVSLDRSLDNMVIV